jgi:hypothetical protein
VFVKQSYSDSSRTEVGSERLLELDCASESEVLGSSGVRVMSPKN